MVLEDDLFQDDASEAAWYEQQQNERQQHERYERMKARQQSAGGQFEPIEAGIYPMVCDKVIDLGLQAPFNPAHKTVYKVLIGFQVPSERRDDGDPQTLTIIATNSMHKKSNLRKVIENWFGKAFPTDQAANDFDLKALLGKAAYGNVTHAERGEKTYANIAALMPLPKGIDAPQHEGELLYYSEAGDQPETERSVAYRNLPEWIRTKVDNQVRAEDVGADYDDADIPF